MLIFNKVLCILQIYVHYMIIAVIKFKINSQALHIKINKKN